MTHHSSHSAFRWPVAARNRLLVLLSMVRAGNPRVWAHLLGGLLMVLSLASPPGQARAGGRSITIAGHARYAAHMRLSRVPTEQANLRVADDAALRPTTPLQASHEEKPTDFDDAGGTQSVTISAEPVSTTGDTGTSDSPLPDSNTLYETGSGPNGKTLDESECLFECGSGKEGKTCVCQPVTAP